MRKTLGDFFFGVVVGEDDDFNARSEQSRDDVALQEVDDCHAVVGGDEDTFHNECFANGWKRIRFFLKFELALVRETFYPLLDSRTNVLPQFLKAG